MTRTPHWREERMMIWRWTSGFETVSGHTQFSLGEGNTPLIRSRRLGPQVGLENLYLKLEPAIRVVRTKAGLQRVPFPTCWPWGRSVAWRPTSGNTGVRAGGLLRGCRFRVLHRHSREDADWQGSADVVLRCEGLACRGRHFGRNVTVDRTRYGSLRLRRARGRLR